jgi:hypothetical protein
LISSPEDEDLRSNYTDYPPEAGNQIEYGLYGALFNWDLLDMNPEFTDAVVDIENWRK